MEIIYNTNPNKDKIDVTCRECESILRITYEDIINTVSIGTYVDCPVCHEHVYIEQIPTNWRNKIDWDE